MKYNNRESIIFLDNDLYLYIKLNDINIPKSWYLTYMVEETCVPPKKPTVCSLMTSLTSLRMHYLILKDVIAFVETPLFDEKTNNFCFTLRKDRKLKTNRRQFEMEFIYSSTDTLPSIPVREVQLVTVKSDTKIMRRCFMKKRGTTTSIELSAFNLHGLPINPIKFITYNVKYSGNESNRSRLFGNVYIMK